MAYFRKCNVFLLQMKYALLDLLRTSLIPKLCSDVSACTAGNAHLILITVAAVRALPDQLAGSFFLDDLDLSVVTAYLTVITFGIQLSIHDVVVDIFHNGQYRLDIVLHIRNFHVTDCTARRKLLEL